MHVRVRNLARKNKAFESIVNEDLSNRAGSLYDSVKLLVGAWNGTAAEIGDDWLTFYTDTLWRYLTFTHSYLQSAANVM